MTDPCSDSVVTKMTFGYMRNGTAMSLGKIHSLFARLGSFVVLTLVLTCCNGEKQPGDRALPVSVIVMEQPAHFGSGQRPAVEFPHALHGAALKNEGCGTCHVVDDKQRIRSALVGVDETEDADRLAEQYHAVCIDCHQERADSEDPTGPLDCGECHIPRPAGISSRAMPRFDYSLHYRHVKAEGDKCETCHHVYNEEKRTLGYAEGQESACRACHGQHDEGKLLSLRNASHVECISCHLSRSAKPHPQSQNIGPVACEGCHDKEKLQAVEKLAEVPRLKRQQPDVTWISAPETGTAGRVLFSHVFHETLTTACSDCHHKTLDSCLTCHTSSGKEEGGWVTLAQAYHSSDSKYSCVGCHEEYLQNKPECSSCHHMLGSAPHESSCKNCHVGPPPASSPRIEQPSGLPVIQMAPLPGPSESFPEEVVIDDLTDKYGPSRLPHLDIVNKLDESVRQSKLARRFHARLEVLCAGCHHHSPRDARPPSCRSCHPDSPHPVEDKPGLMPAFHRQCIGCHEQLELESALGCEDCHAKAAKEVVK